MRRSAIDWRQRRSIVGRDLRPNDRGRRRSLGNSVLWEIRRLIAACTGGKSGVGRSPARCGSRRSRHLGVFEPSPVPRWRDELAWTWSGLEFRLQRCGGASDRRTGGQRSLWGRLREIWWIGRRIHSHIHRRVHPRVQRGTLRCVRRCVRSIRHGGLEPGLFVGDGLGDRRRRRVGRGRRELRKHIRWELQISNLGGRVQARVVVESDPIVGPDLALPRHRADLPGSEGPPNLAIAAHHEVRHPFRLPVQLGEARKRL